MKKSATVLLALVSMGFAPRGFGAEEYRVFTNTAGRTVKAKLVSFSNGVATIVTETGQTFPLKPEALSPPDREYVQANSPGAPNDKVTPAGINEAAGQSIFSDTALWESNADEVAQRLSLKPESKTKLDCSFRAYPDETYRLFWARPFSVALYGVGDKPTSISLVYANKGDSFRCKGQR